MELLISKLLNGYESGRITRRQLISALALAAGKPQTRPTAGFQVKGIDHVSIVARNPQRSADFYRNVFGLDTVQPSAAGVAGGALTDGSIRVGIGHSVVVIRPGRKPGIVDHFAFGVEPFDQNSLGRLLTERNIKWSDQGDAGFHATDPDGIDCSSRQANSGEGLAAD